jgi:hypothetical protein
MASPYEQVVRGRDSGFGAMAGRFAGFARLHLLAQVL